jgi:hypothetical protein
VAGRKPDADSPAGTAVLGAAVVQAEQLAGPVPHQIQILASRFGSPQDRRRARHSGSGKRGNP